MQAAMGTLFIVMAYPVALPQRSDPFSGAEKMVCKRRSKNPSLKRPGCPVDAVVTQHHGRRLTERLTAT
jgi:hypothetical protein